MNYLKNTLIKLQQLNLKQANWYLAEKTPRFDARLLGKPGNEK